MYEAATKGLTWRVISADAMDVKGLGDIIQAGCNASAQLARGESEFQILKRVMNSINAHGGVGKQILFSSVKQAIMKTKPQCHEAIPEMFTFLVRYGSTTSLQERITQTEARIKASKDGPRSLGRDFYQNLSMDPKDTKQETFVMFRHALLSLAYSGKDRKMIGAADARKVVSKDPVILTKLQLCQNIMKRLRNHFSSKLDFSKLDREVAVGCKELLHESEDTCVLLALDKKVGVKSNEEAACLFVDKIEELTQIKLTSDYDSFRPTVVPTAAAPCSKGALNLWLKSKYIIIGAFKFPPGRLKGLEFCGILLFSCQRSLDQR